MTWAMAELTRNPRVMRKVQSEIRNKFGNRELISFADTEHLSYLKMVIKETWRLHPTSPLLLPREVMSEFELNGYTIQPKTRLRVNVWGIGRDPNTWKDQRRFYPRGLLIVTLIQLIQRDRALSCYLSGVAEEYVPECTWGQQWWNLVWQICCIILTGRYQKAERSTCTCSIVLADTNVHK